jgi:hypothetical protein
VAQGDPGGQHQGGVRQVVSAPTCQCNESFGNAHEGERSALTTNTASQKPHHYANYPVATKRVLRAMLKATDFCASNPAAVARRLVDGGFTGNYDYALQTLNEVWYNKWREYDAEDSVRFYSLRLREAGMIKSAPGKIIADGTNWRFLNELKRELKG